MAQADGTRAVWLALVLLFSPAVHPGQPPLGPPPYPGLDTGNLPWNPRPGVSVSDLARAADTVEAYAGSLRKVEAPHEHRDDLTRRVSAYFDGKDLLLVVEEIRGELRASEQRYFFEGNWLYHHRATAIKPAPDGSGSMRIERRLYLSPDGSALFASKRLGGRTAAVTREEIERIRNEAFTLRQVFR